MNKKVVLFTTYLLESDCGYLFGDRANFQLSFFQSKAMQDFFLDDPKTLKCCSDYLAIMEWKKNLSARWSNEFVCPFWKDELKRALNFYKKEDQSAIDTYKNDLKPKLGYTLNQIKKEEIRLAIKSDQIADDNECQRFAPGDLHLYWGDKDAPELPLLHRRFSLYSLNNVTCPSYVTYAVWPIRYDTANKAIFNKWKDALIQEIIERTTPPDDCEEIILAIHDRDAGRIIPFDIRELDKAICLNGKQIKYSLVLFDHTNSEVHKLLKRIVDSKSVYEEICELIGLH